MKITQTFSCVLIAASVTNFPTHFPQEPQTDRAGATGDKQ